MFVGPYEVGAPIGAGGMGTVYEAVAPDGAPVAIKLLHRQHLANRHVMRRFLDEAAAGLVVNHPNVVSVLAHGESDGLPFLVMDRVCGETLGVRVARDGAPSLRSAACIVQQILGGLEAMHAMGVVHGDVKSDNIIVERHDDGRDTAKLIDLGLARVMFVAEDTERRAEDDMISGTPEYMAPELVQGHASTPVSDLYAVGVILYELITGTTPFGGGTPREIMERQLADEVILPSLRCGCSLPPLLERIVMHALAKDPAKRFKSAGEFLEALELAMENLDESMFGTRTISGEFSREAPTLAWARGERRRLAHGSTPPRTPALP